MDKVKLVVDEMSERGANLTFRALPDGVVLVELSGVITVDIALQLVAQAEQRAVAEGARIRGAVIDYRGATLSVSGSDMARFRERLPGSILDCPVAVLASGLTAVVLWAHCCAAAAMGRPRKMVRSTAQGHAWVRRMSGIASD